MNKDFYLVLFFSLSSMFPAAHSSMVPLLFVVLLSPGATESEYRVYNIDRREMAGVYMCLVSNNHNGQVLSKGAVLQIGEISNIHNHFGRSLCDTSQHFRAGWGSVFLSLQVNSSVVFLCLTCIRHTHTF